MSAPPPAGYAVQTLPPSRLEQYLFGDWSGAIRAVVLGVGAMFVTGLLLLSMAASSAGASGSVVVALPVVSAAAVALASGGRLELDLPGFASGASAALAVRPLLLTFVGFGVMAISFVRRLRDIEALSPVTVAFQAIRMALCLVIVLIPVTLAGNRGGGAVQVDYLSTCLFGVVTLAVALLFASVLGLPNLFQGRAARWREAVAGSLRASLWFVAIACVLTIVLYFVGIALLSSGPFTISPAAVRTQFFTLLLGLPNAAILLVFGCLLAPVTPALGDDTFSMADLPALTVENAVLWIAMAILLALFVTAGIMAARRSPPGRRWSALWLVVVLPVVLFLLGLSLMPIFVRELFVVALAGAGIAAVYSLVGGLVGALIPRAQDEQPDPEAWRPIP